MADNPGTWMFHCHLDFHSEVGMALLIKVGKDQDLPGEPINWPQCGNYKYAGLKSSNFASKLSPFIFILIIISITITYLVL